MKFSQLKLSTSLLLSLEAIGYKTATEVQAKVIPEVLARHDVLVKAKTGSGKTAAYLLPIIQLLSPYGNKSTSPANHPLQALILAPTRELTQQIGKNLKDFLQMSDLRSTTIYGGNNINLQITELKMGVEIVVSTVGRLLDHIQNKTISLDQINYLVLDEADRMLDMGFLPQLNEIINFLPKSRQNLLFSATYSIEIKKLANKYLRDAISINIHQEMEVSDNVVHRYCLAEEKNKISNIELIMNQKPKQQALIFTNTKINAKKVAKILKSSHFLVDELHGDMSQFERDQVMNQFRIGTIQLLVATDVAARGLDIPSLPLVINYSPPNIANEYIHRVGRTGRAGKPGEAITLCAKNELDYLTEIENLLDKKIPKITIKMPKPQKPINENININNSQTYKDKRAKTITPALLRKPNL